MTRKHSFFIFERLHQVQNLRLVRLIRTELGIDGLGFKARVRLKDRIMRFCISILRLTLRALLSAAKAIVTFVGFLFSAAQTGNRRDSNSTTIQYGTLNYRTLELDEGTDPYGWYD